MLVASRSADFNCVNSYALEKVDSIKPDAFKPSFTNLPADPYLKGNYRFRRLSRFRVENNSLIRLPHDGFFQSKEYNPLLGNIKREYAELDPELIELEDFQNLVFEFFSFCHTCSTPNEIGVHQIRITSSQQHRGSPAPEGIHRDGVDLVGIFCVNREKIAGGETHLYKAQKEKPIFNKILAPGELLVFNDHQFLHFTSPIKAVSIEDGVRDVFVLTSPGLPSPENH